jgi:hypothetical protein
MRPAVAHLVGLALFLFIPVVLFLFVRHPAPIAASLTGGVGLMLGHRLLARPYMERVRDRRCVWCARTWQSPPGADLVPAVEVTSATGRVQLLACPRHVAPTRRFMAFVDRFRLPLRLGIAVPLAGLLGALALALTGETAALQPATALFQLLVGLTVNAAAWGYLAAGEPARTRGAFPLHNFYLLGLRILLWIFRLIGIWWIVAGAAWWIARFR